MAEPKPDPLPLRAQLDARLVVLREQRSISVKNTLVLREQVTNAEQNVSAIEGGIRELERLIATLPAEEIKK